MSRKVAARGEYTINVTCLSFALTLVCSAGCGSIDPYSEEQTGKAEQASQRNIEFSYEKSDDGFDSIIATNIDNQEERLVLAVNRESNLLNISFNDASYEIDPRADSIEQLTSSNFPEQLGSFLVDVLNSNNAMITELLKRDDVPDEDQMSDVLYGVNDFQLNDPFPTQELKWTAIGLATGWAVWLAVGYAAGLMSAAAAAESASAYTAWMATLDKIETGYWMGEKIIYKAGCLIPMITGPAAKALSFTYARADVLKAGAAQMKIYEAAVLEASTYGIATMGAMGALVPALNDLAVGTCDSFSCIMNEMPDFAACDALP